MATSLASDPQPTVQKLIDEYNKVKDEYHAIDFAQNLSVYLTGKLSGIDNIIVLGLGPEGLHNDRITASQWQLAFAQHMAELISAANDNEVPIYSQDSYRGLLKGSLEFTEAWEQFLSDVGINVLVYRQTPGVMDLNTGPAFDKMTSSSLFYTPCCVYKYSYLYLEKKDPLFHVGNANLGKIWGGADVYDKSFVKMPLEQFEAMQDWERLPGFGHRVGETVRQLGADFMFRRKDI